MASVAEMLISSEKQSYKIRFAKSSLTKSDLQSEKYFYSQGQDFFHYQK